MKYTPGLLSITIILTLLLSCTKVIDIDTNASDPQIVVQGSVPSDGDKPFVKLMKSVNFDESNNYPAVNNAIVIIVDDAGNSDVLTEKAPGVYEADTITGVSGRTYNLSIIIEDKTITSTSTIPDKVTLDSIIVSELAEGNIRGIASGKTYEVYVKYTDPANTNNYYRFIESVNGVETGDVYVFDDRLTNGLALESPLLKFNRQLKSKDVLTIEMQCIDKNVYNYFKSFGNLSGGPQNSSTPANPYTDLIGTKLGYFSAHTTDRKNHIIH